CTIYGSDYW
nr:immunoglobulin heavy chain junction region [Homo sapiens]